MFASSVAAAAGDENGGEAVETGADGAERPAKHPGHEETRQPRQVPHSLHDEHREDLVLGGDLPEHLGSTQAARPKVTCLLGADGVAVAVESEDQHSGVAAERYKHI